MKKSKLTNKQAAFCREYLIDSNATQAAIRAGYAKGSAEVTGCNLLRNTKVAKELERLRIPLVEKAAGDAEWVRKELMINIESAKKSRDHGSINNALKQLGEQNGQFTKKVEVSGELEVHNVEVTFVEADTK